MRETITSEAASSAMFAAATSRRPSKTNGSAAAALTAEPDERRQLQPGDQREGGHAREAAQQVDHVGPQRRPAGSARGPCAARR
jgi:hypothetical protein